MSEPSLSGEERKRGDLPILSTAIRAAVLPFANLATFARFVWIPFAAMSAVTLGGWVLAYFGVSQNDNRVIAVIANTLVFTPFAVAWFRLAILGAPSVARRPVFAVGKIELAYLAAYSILILALGVTFGLPALLVQAAHTNYYITHERLPLTGAVMVLLVGASASLIMCIRCSFVFPAVAIQRYVGFQAALQQTRGYFERMLAIEAIAFSPWMVLNTLIEQAERSSGSLYTGSITTAVLEIAGVALHTILVATAISTVALAYKFIVFDRPEPELATQAIAAAD